MGTKTVLLFMLRLVCFVRIHLFPGFGTVHHATIPPPSPRAAACNPLRVWLMLYFLIILTRACDAPPSYTPLPLAAAATAAPVSVK